MTDRALRCCSAPDVWSPLEYACHVRDVCRIYLERLKLMLTRDDPAFANWDQDATAVCPRIRFAGHGTFDGALRDYLAWPASLLHPLPEALSDAEGAMLEPLGVALHAPRPRPPAARRQRGGDRMRADRAAAHPSRQGGRRRAVLAGIPDQDSTTFPASVARRKGLTIAMSRRMNDTYPRAIELVRRGAVDLAPLVTDRYRLADAPEAFAAAASRRGVKTIVEP